jgi:hypothetical protein
VAPHGGVLGFGSIEVEGREYGHDIVIEQVRSSALRSLKRRVARVVFNRLKSGVNR